MLMFPALIAVVGVKPNAVDPAVLKMAGSNPAQLSHWEKNGFEYKEYFNDSPRGERNVFGSSLAYYFVKKHLTGTPDPFGLFYLMVSCKTCGQSNPTRIALDRDKFVTRDARRMLSSRSPDWNRLTEDDLRKCGLRIDNLPKEKLEAHLSRPFHYPEEHDVRNLGFIDCRCNCINCGDVITWSSEDTFI